MKFKRCLDERTGLEKRRREIIRCGICVRVSQRASVNVSESDAIRWHCSWTAVVNWRRRYIVKHSSSTTILLKLMTFLFLICLFFNLIQLQLLTDIRILSLHMFIRSFQPILQLSFDSQQFQRELNENRFVLWPKLLSSKNGKCLPAKITFFIFIHSFYKILFCFKQIDFFKIIIA